MIPQDEPPLTRRRSPDCATCWHVHRGDVRVGTISRDVGLPHAAERWTWHAGLGSAVPDSPRRSGTAPTFEAARAGFSEAWRSIAPLITEADYRRWRDERDWTAAKYARWDRGERIPVRR